MTYGTKNRFLLTTLSLSLCQTLSASYSAPDAGLLNQQLKQSQQQTKVKPSGELFNNQSTETKQADDQNGPTFKLEEVKLVDLNGQPLYDDLSAVLQSYLQKEVTLAQLHTLTQAITNHYRQHNYLVARAILPPQEIQHGHVVIQVIKGKLGQIQINNQSALRENLIQRIAKANLQDEQYLQKTALENLALRLNDIQGVKPALALKAGAEQGSSDVTINLENTSRFSGYAMLDNQGNKDTGEYRLTLGGKVYNLLGFADDLSIAALSSQNANLNSALLDYAGLIDGYGTRLGVSANYLRYKLGGNFKDLNAQGDSYNAGVYLLHPTVRLPDMRLNIKAGFNHQVLKDKQSAVDLAQKRKVNTLYLNLNGSWHSTKNGISYFSLGTVFGKEGNNTNEKIQYQSETFKTKKAFTLFNYSLSHEQHLPRSFALNLGLSGQFSDKNLDSSQKLLLGGLYAVRGYKSGAASVDEGHVFQAELKHYLPLFQSSILTSSLFYDYAWGKYYKKTAELAQNLKNNVTLQSISAGLALSQPNNYSINLSMAKPLGTKLENTDSHQFWLSALKTF